MKNACILSLLASLAMLSPAAARADSSGGSSCSELSRSLRGDSAEVAQLQERRDTLLERTELAGDEWESLEEQRLFSADHAARADTARTAYETEKQRLLDTEAELQAVANDYNRDVARFNRTCATN